MSDPVSFRAVIELWESQAAMASDIGAKASAVSKWWQRDNIPSEWWSSILLSKVGTDADLTAGALTALAARKVTTEPDLLEARP